MKKISAFLIICMMLCPLIIFSDFTENTQAIGQHEVDDGIAYGEIFTDSIPYNNTHWDTSSQTVDPRGMTTDGISIWVASRGFGLDAEIFRYNMAGVYQDSFDTEGETDYPGGITTNGSSLWITSTTNPETVFRYNIAGTYQDSFSVNSQTETPVGITTDDNNIWVYDISTDAVYKYSMAGNYQSSWSTVSQCDMSGLATDGTYFYLVDYNNPQIHKYNMTGVYQGFFYTEPTNSDLHGITFNGTDFWTVDDSDDEVFKYSVIPNFNVTREVSSETESNKILSFNPSEEYIGNVTLKIPVSSDVQGIIDTTNNTDDIEAIEVNTSDELVNNTYWYDSTNKFVHIRTVDLSVTTIVNWTINCSYGATFNLIIPSYLEVGQYFHSEGFITDADGNAISGMIAETRLLYANGTDALSVNPKHNCTNGNYKCTFSTSTLLPGTYSVSIEFTDPDSGIVFKEGGTLYLSTDPGSGIYISTFLHFTFYNSDTGIGIASESFKIYSSTDITIDSTDRIYVDLYGVYTGQTIYYRVDDYFDNQIYPTSGDYETLVITSTNQFENIPIDWHSFSVKNMNHSIVHFNMTNVTRAYTQYLFPYEPFYWNVLAGEYTINLTYYDPIDDSIVSYSEENIRIDDDTYYWIRGYDLRDIIIEVQFTNTTVGNLEITITANIDIVNSTVNNITTNIQTSLSLTESNLTAINNLIWNAINITDSVVDYLNNTMWTEFNAINLTVDNINNNIWTNFTFLESGINNLSISISSNLSFDETNITNLIIDVWNSLNISNSTINELNATIWNNLTFLQNTMGDVNLSIRNVVFLVENNISSLIITIENILDIALMPDIEIIVYNPPMIYSVYDKKGMAIGSNIYKICPAFITIATTRFETTGNWVNSTAMVPGNDTVTNGTITILSDELYVSGSNAINWVSITYTDNGTLYQNTTHIPSKINLYSQNLTINASGDIHILRETTYHQEKKFYWTYNANTGKHTAAESIINPMAIPIYDVYAYMQFSNQSTPDPNTVIMKDVSNDGVISEYGGDYDVSLCGIHFSILSIDADSTRGFTFEYYKRFDDAYRYGEETVSVSGSIETVWNGLSFNKCIISYINNENTIFRGGLYASLNFDVPTEIDGNSIRIWDENNNHELNESCFIFGSGFVRIDASGLGDVAPGGGRRFSMYFLLREYPGADPTEFHLNTPIWMGITPFLIIFIIGAIIISYGAYAYIFKNKKDWWKGIVLGVFIIFIFYVLAYMGV